MRFHQNGYEERQERETHSVRSLFIMRGFLVRLVIRLPLRDIAVSDVSTEVTEIPFSVRSPHLRLLREERNLPD